MRARVCVYERLNWVFFKRFIDSCNLLSPPPLDVPQTLNCFQVLVVYRYRCQPRSTPSLIGSYQTPAGSSAPRLRSLGLGLVASVQASFVLTAHHVLHLDPAKQYLPLTASKHLFPFAVPRNDPPPPSQATALLLCALPCEQRWILFNRKPSQPT